MPWGCLASKKDMVPTLGTPKSRLPEASQGRAFSHTIWQAVSWPSFSAGQVGNIYQSYKWTYSAFPLLDALQTDVHMGELTDIQSYSPGNYL